LKWSLEKKNPELAARFSGLFVGMRDARKFFRLFKTVNEYQKILQLLGKGGDDEIDLILQLLNRLCFAGYWIFDNIVILCTAKFFKQDSKKFNKAGMWFWFLGLLFGVIQTIRSTFILERREKAITSKLHEA